MNLSGSVFPISDQFHTFPVIEAGHRRFITELDAHYEGKWAREKREKEARLFAEIMARCKKERDETNKYRLTFL